ncbi:dymeclin isoform X5 [Myotis myotis]|uniref:dymeclin isoform X5 n=1 Tax=Myotis myotis TaxID=51298 RepID=UPI00174BC055|nr:dymeclin isoform X5 [Myotis myotis]
MGSNSSRLGDLPKNEYLKKLSGTESVSENDPFWNQLLSFSFPAPTSSTDLKLLEEATISVCRSLGSDSEDLLEELVCCLMQLITDIPLIDLTYEISVEAISTMVVFLSCQLYHKEVLRQSISHKYLMRGRCLPYTSKLVKTLLYNFIRQEKPPPPGAHVFPQQSDGGGLLYGLASGVATGLWTVFTLGGVGSKAAATQAISSPLANQSLLLLLVLANLTDAADAPNPYRQAIISFKNTQDNSPFPSSIPHAFQINFNSLYTTLCEQQTSDQATLLLYTLLHQNSNIRTYMLARTDMENLVLPILEILYHVEERNSHHVYMALIILLILTEDDGFNRSIHEVILKNITWYSERVLTEISLGSLLILVVIRTIQYNMTRTRDKYLHTNCLAALANMSAQFRSLHQYAAQRIISYINQEKFNSSLFSLLSKKHNKVLEQATQSLRGSLSSNDVPLPDYAQDLNVIEEVIRMMLEIINSCLATSLHHNPNLVYALLYKRDLFEQFRTHPSFQDIMQNIDLVITFFSSRLLQAGAELSVERVLEIIKQGIVALPKDRLKLPGFCDRSEEHCLFREVSGIEIQVCGRGAARGVLHPLRLVPGVQLGRRPVLEPAGHPAVHDGLRLRAARPPATEHLLLCFSGEQTGRWPGVSPVRIRKQACFPCTLGCGAAVPVGSRSLGFNSSTKGGGGTTIINIQPAVPHAILFISKPEPRAFPGAAALGT